MDGRAGRHTGVPPAAHDCGYSVGLGVSIVDQALSSLTNAVRCPGPKCTIGVLVCSGGSRFGRVVGWWVGVFEAGAQGSIFPLLIRSSGWWLTRAKLTACCSDLTEQHGHHNYYWYCRYRTTLSVQVRKYVLSKYHLGICIAKIPGIDTESTSRYSTVILTSSTQIIKPDRKKLSYFPLTNSTAIQVI